ncbi:MAG TPA: SDR family oxidoreductase [Candidatus Eisenbergiella merdipullorum]|uniref:SDR family oxidoreductase n=1 Tax=Candidatus Eisenbergiella merdipullorum TaxID=2838553 RepID=A0A9D2I3L5_9FIRM|nr:SDR family oxidoreductase [Candidatus Eisenbergiella merdipullorum]
MLRGNKAIVTGASRGIGFAIAKELANDHCKVVITGRDQKTLEEAADKMEGDVIPMVWDVSQIESADAKIKEAAEIMNGLNIVVNNAGIFARRREWDKNSLLNTTVDEWEAVMKTNTSSVFFTMQAAVKYMLIHNIKGNILNITSVAGKEPVYGAYGASKIAAMGLTRGWGKMFADSQITINGIAPGPAATEMNHWHDGDSLQNSKIPFGRFATIDEIAKLALYLLSEEAEMICGETVILDGAYAIR